MKKGVGQMTWFGQKGFETYGCQRRNEAVGRNINLEMSARC